MSSPLKALCFERSFGPENSRHPLCFTRRQSPSLMPGSLSNFLKSFKSTLCFSQQGRFDP